MSDVQAPEAVNQDLGSLIGEALRRRIRRRAGQAERYGGDFAELWAQMAEHAAGGKLLRPRLFLDTAEALAHGRVLDRDLLIELGVGIEMLHYAFLLHDDVIDRDFRRRQGVNLLGEVRDAHPAPQSEAARRWGTAVGILAGDLMISEVHQIFARARVRETAGHRLLDLLDDTIQASVCGEAADVGLSVGAVDPTLSAALSMTQYKTATYSFELPLRAAAIVEGADEVTESALTAAARHMGIAYQLQDDLLSAFGDPQRHGKESGSDFREGKQTPLIAYARTTDWWPQIADCLGRGDITGHDTATAHNTEQLRALLRDCGAEQFIHNLLTQHLSALDHLLEGSSPISAEVRRVLSVHSDAMRGRSV
ncbi:polyprenyl synthetase family protein [Garicola koreensis]|uniref:Geranylgeranyl diphosphate synthase type II n=1 Tax=Garicola koreensis TaxID=1262554 RepID=A0A7W5TRY7_9MICC|nr:polyprenyl synthetase family protein [Garicola koreensis]MBB3666648.1 geranylgeranyl diphosphate synthase type II [Garicola koreensis]